MEYILDLWLEVLETLRRVGCSTGVCHCPPLPPSSTTALHPYHINSSLLIFHVDFIILVCCVGVNVTRRHSSLKDRVDHPLSVSEIVFHACFWTEGGSHSTQINPRQVGSSQGLNQDFPAARPPC